jgi:hypothetical protein
MARGVRVSGRVILLCVHRIAKSPAPALALARFRFRGGMGADAAVGRARLALARLDLIGRRSHNI